MCIRDRDRIDNDSYVKRIEAFGGVKKLDFNKPVTFFVGENGSAFKISGIYFRR